MISILKAPAYLTVQDLGWPSSRSMGMPISGAMDRWALAAANALAGNAPGAPALEWALTGGRLRFERDAVVTLCGARVAATLDDHVVSGERAIPVRAGSVLAVERFTAGRFLYLGVAGGVEVPLLRGSAATYLPAGFGGFRGRVIKTGDVVPLAAGSRHFRESSLPPGLGPRYDAEVVRVVEGPQRVSFAGDDWAWLLASSWRVSHASDRMGFRLEGGAPCRSGPADLPSEAACPGAIQVPPEGLPIVLMPDGPTVGGYPKIAVVISADLPIVAQRAVGETVRFQAVSMADAQAALRRRERELEELLP